MANGEIHALVSDLANFGFREDLIPTMELSSIGVADPITAEEAEKMLTEQRLKLHGQYQSWMREIEIKIKERAKAALRTLEIILVAVIVLSSSAYASPKYVQQQQVTIQQPAGQWVLYNRPTWVGNMVFGPIWVFIPAQPAVLQQSPAPAFSPAIPPLNLPAATK